MVGGEANSTLHPRRARFGGAALAYLAVDPEVAGASGRWYDSYPPSAHQLAVHAASAEAQDAAKAKELWELSVKLVA